MCGTVKHNSLIHKRGFAVITSEGSAIWSGFSTLEKADFWLSKGSKTEILVNSFTEGGLEISNPAGTFKGLKLTKDVVISNKTIGRTGEVKIITRKPLTEFEKKIHHRWPVAIKDGKIVQWTESDVLK
jgi:hypothetical protein